MYTRACWEWTWIGYYLYIQSFCTFTVHFTGNTLFLSLTLCPPREVHVALYIAPERRLVHSLILPM